MKIGIVVFDGIIPFHLSVPFAVFEKVLAPSGAPLCELTLCAAEPGELKTNAGFSIVVNLGLGALSGMDMVIVPSWDAPARQPEPALLDALRHAHAAGATVVGLCMGAFVLAAAGLLNHRRATTHWRWLPDFQQRYPAVLVENDVLYLDEGDVVTSAGTAAGIDCCLHLVRKRWGADMAAQAARQLVVPLTGKADNRSMSRCRCKIPARGITFPWRWPGRWKTCIRRCRWIVSRRKPA